VSVPTCHVCRAPQRYVRLAHSASWTFWGPTQIAGSEVVSFCSADPAHDVVGDMLERIRCELAWETA